MLTRGAGVNTSHVRLCVLLVSLNLVFHFLDFNCIAMEKKQTKKTKKKTEAETPTEAIAFP